MAWDDFLSDSSYNYDYTPDTSGSYLNDISDYYTPDTDYTSDFDFFSLFSPNTPSFNYPSTDSLSVRGTDTGSQYSGYTPGYTNPNLASNSDQSVWFLDNAANTLDKVGSYLQTPGGSLLTQLGGATIGALGAMYQNKLQKDAQKKYKKMLAERKAEAEKYSSPLHLEFNRQAITPEARNGESLFFSNNKLPSYYAEGGSTNQDQPSVLGFIKYLMAGKKLPSEVQEQKEAERQRLLNTSEPSAEAGLVKTLNRKQMIDKELESYCGGGLANYVKGGTSGQSDKINAMLSDGEYVMDADVVSALGDGNNEAGAKALDQMRENVRSHKRSAPANKIPPKAKSPLEYMKGKKEKK